MMQAGEGGITYPNFKDFSVDEVLKLMGLQVSHGLSPTPQVSMKFKSQMQMSGGDTTKHSLPFRIPGRLLQTERGSQTSR